MKHKDELWAVTAVSVKALTEVKVSMADFRTFREVFGTRANGKTLLETEALPEGDGE